MPNQFNGTISKSAVNLEKIGRADEVKFLAYHATPSHTPRPDRAKISHFQKMLGFTQYGPRLFGIDARRAA